MKPLRTHVIFGDLGILVLLAVGRMVLHTVTNSQYGFHRDELAMLDDARYLAWGYVAYPPVTPLIGRVALVLFGPSLVGMRFFSALAQSIAMVLAGLITRELDGTRLAQIVTAAGRGHRADFAHSRGVVPIRFVRLPMVGINCLLCGPTLEIRRPALVAGYRGCYRIGDADEVHHGLLCGGPGCWGHVHERTSLPG